MLFQRTKTVDQKRKVKYVKKIKGNNIGYYSQVELNY